MEPKENEERELGKQTSKKIRRGRIRNRDVSTLSGYPSTPAEA